jgi:phosphatidylserine decarboxylase
MTPYEQAVKASKELAENTQEILANLRSVRGEVFSTAVAAAFEVRQLVDINARIALEGKDNQFLVDMTLAATELAASIAAKTAFTLSSEEVEEVIKMAEQLHNRRMRLMQDIKKGV